MFLPITYVFRDKNSSPLVGKEQPANNSSGALESDAITQSLPKQDDVPSKQKASHDYDYDFIMYVRTCISYTLFIAKCA